MAALPSSSHVHATSKSRTYTWMSDVTRSDKAGNHYSTVCIQWSLASAEAPPPLSLTNPLVELPSTIGGAGNVRATSEPDCTIQMVRQLSAVTGSTPAPATKACIIRVGDCVTARSASKECASSMSIALVEDLWASSARHAPGQDCQRFIRLRWFLTINGIAISRARLPRGSQVRLSYSSLLSLVARRWLHLCCTPLVSQSSCPRYVFTGSS